MNKLTRLSATVVSSLALVAGFSGIASAESSYSYDEHYQKHGVHQNYNDDKHHDDYGHRGGDINTDVDIDSNYEVDVNNNTNLNLNNNNPQSAYSGDVYAEDNTTAGHVYSGEAWNESDLLVRAEVDNSASTSDALSGGNFGGGLSALTGGSGQSSYSNDDGDVNTNFDYSEDYSVSVNNNTNVSVNNNNDQKASSGNVYVEDNTTVGNVYSGNAKNSSITTFDFMVKN